MKKLVERFQCFFLYLLIGLGFLVLAPTTFIFDNPEQAIDSVDNKENVRNLLLGGAVWSLLTIILLCIYSMIGSNV